MKRILMTLAVLGLLVAVRAVFPPHVVAGEISATGVWADVCCGSHCTPADYCIGNGTYTCCKGGSE